MCVCGVSVLSVELLHTVCSYSHSHTSSSNARLGSFEQGRELQNARKMASKHVTKKLRRNLPVRIAPSMLSSDFANLGMLVISSLSLSNTKRRRQTLMMLQRLRQRG